jgi:hypothetical protein
LIDETAAGQQSINATGDDNVACDTQRQCSAASRRGRYYLPHSRPFSRDPNSEVSHIIATNGLEKFSPTKVPSTHSIKQRNSSAPCMQHNWSAKQVFPKTCSGPITNRGGAPARGAVPGHADRTGQAAGFGQPAVRSVAAAGGSSGPPSLSIRQDRG